MSGMLDRTLFVAVSRLNGEVAALGPHVEAHLAFMIDLEQRGILFASGPFKHPGGGANTGEGLTIVRAASIDEARALLEKDPFVTSGARRFELYEWHLLEGALQLTVYASQQRGAVP